MDRLPYDVLDLVVQETIKDDLVQTHCLTPTHCGWSWNDGAVYRILRRLCQVDRVLAKVAQRHLMRRVSFERRGLEASTSYLAYTMPRWGSTVTSLALMFDLLPPAADAPDATLSAIVAALPLLSSLCITYIVNIPVVYPRTWTILLQLTTIRGLSVNDFCGDPSMFPHALVDAHAPRLVSYLAETCFFEAESGAPLEMPAFGPGLQHLWLFNSWPTLESLPSEMCLTALDFAWTSSSPEASVSSLAIVTRTASSLKTLTLTSGAAIVIESAASSNLCLPNLRSLYADDDHGQNPALPDALKSIQRLQAPRLTELFLKTRKGRCALLAARFSGTSGEDRLFPQLRRLVLVSCFTLEDPPPAYDDPRREARLPDAAERDGPGRVALESLLTGRGVRFEARYDLL